MLRPGSPGADPTLRLPISGNPQRGPASGHAVALTDAVCGWHRLGGQWAEVAGGAGPGGGCVLGRGGVAGLGGRRARGQVTLQTGAGLSGHWPRPRDPGRNGTGGHRATRLCTAWPRCTCLPTEATCPSIPGAGHEDSVSGASGGRGGWGGAGRATQGTRSSGNTRGQPGLVPASFPARASHARPGRAGSSEACARLPGHTGCPGRPGQAHRLWTGRTQGQEGSGGLWGVPCREERALQTAQPQLLASPRQPAGRGGLETAIPGVSASQGPGRDGRGGPQRKGDCKCPGSPGQSSRDGCSLWFFPGGHLGLGWWARRAPTSPARPGPSGLPALVSGVHRLSQGTPGFQVRRTVTLDIYFPSLVSKLLF